MLNLHSTAGRRIGLWTFSTLMLTSVGCGFPHGRYGSDPLFGSFNRPIAATPPIYTGGDPGLTPAYDGGARMGLPSPDVPAKASPVLEKMFIMPTFNGSMGLNKVFGGNSNGIERVGATSAPAPKQQPMPMGSIGAHMLPTPQPVPERSLFVSGSVPSPNSVTPRSLDSHTSLTSGSALEPVAYTSKPLSASAAMKDPRTVNSVEEAQTILQGCGAKSLVMEAQPTGEWRFLCTVSDGADFRRYEAHDRDQLEAVRSVMWQIKNER